MISDRTLELILVALPPTLLALATLIKQFKVLTSINGRLTELIKTATAEAAAKATLEEKAAEHTRKAEAAQIREAHRFAPVKRINHRRKTR